jgi:hypothetical protein
MDEAAIEDVLWRVACMAWEMRSFVEEIDVNPLMILEQGKGARALDALMVLRKATVGSDKN